MKVIEYIGKILPDGHLSIPEEIRKELELYGIVYSKVTITVIPDEEQNSKCE